MAGAAVGAHTGLASFAHETTGAEAGAIDTASTTSAVAGACLGAAIKSGPSHLTHTN